MQAIVTNSIPLFLRLLCTGQWAKGERRGSSFTLVPLTFSSSLFASERRKLLFSAMPLYFLFLPLLLQFLLLF